MNPSTNTQLKPQRGEVPIPGLKVRVRSVKTELKSVHFRSTKNLKILQTTLNIAKSMIESPSLEGQPELGGKRISQALTSQKNPLPASLSELSNTSLKAAHETLTDREEVVDGLTEDLTKRAAELIQNTPNSSFTKIDLPHVLVGASLSASVVALSMAMAPLPIWAKAAAVVGGLIVGGALVLAKKSVSKYLQLKAVQKEIATISSHVEKVLDNYSQGLEQMMERLRFLLPEKEAAQSLREQEAYKVLLEREVA